MAKSMDEFVRKATELPAFLVNYTKWKLGFCRRLRKYDPVFVFQMGKVGSKSITATLRKTYVGAVIHGHALIYPDHDHTPGEVRELYRYLNSEKPPKRINIISMTRDPISRNVSAFFMNFERYNKIRAEDSKFSLEELRDLFLKNYSHDEPITFFDVSILKHFDIDVYATPFPSCGYNQYEKGPVRLLIFRCELDDEVKNKCVRDFLNMQKFKLVRDNIGEQKTYGEIYRKFKENVRLPKAYVDRMCESRYFKHFYSSDFIENVRKRWSEQ
jgi:hypothetical protein